MLENEVTEQGGYLARVVWYTKAEAVPLLLAPSVLNLESRSAKDYSTGKTMMAPAFQNPIRQDR
jgi:hypothetical protein